MNNIQSTNNESSEDSTPRKRLTLEDRIKQREDRLKALRDEIADLKKKKTAKERKEETRRNILWGAFIRQKMEKDPGLERRLKAEFDAYITRPTDRKVCGLSVPDSPATDVEESTQNPSPGPTTGLSASNERSPSPSLGGTSRVADVSPEESQS